ncbi:hypothetical protein B0H19DRAFT_1077148 [Mycena capillaripes]|nr:hypothetical protein B0H19DRAFT_1077148 [Mycena capillaripes]
MDTLGSGGGGRQTSGEWHNEMRSLLCSQSDQAKSGPRREASVKENNERGCGWVTGWVGEGRGLWVQRMRVMARLWQEHEVRKRKQREGFMPSEIDPRAFVVVDCHQAELYQTCLAFRRPPVPIDLGSSQPAAIRIKKAGKKEERRRRRVSADIDEPPGMGGEKRTRGEERAEENVRVVRWIGGDEGYDGTGVWNHGRNRNQTGRKDTSETKTMVGISSTGAKDSVVWACVVSWFTLLAKREKAGGGEQQWAGCKSRLRKLRVGEAKDPGLDAVLGKRGGALHWRRGACTVIVASRACGGVSVDQWSKERPRSTNRERSQRGLTVDLSGLSGPQVASNKASSANWPGWEASNIKRLTQPQ